MLMINFHKTHGTAIDKNTFNVDVDLLKVNTRLLGGGASQNFAALKLLEHYIAYEHPQYVVEIGSQKGGLSVYLGTVACATQQFLFHTFEINKSQAWNDRTNEGIGHWFETMESISPYCKSHEVDIFSKATYDYINQFASKYKTLIICDGGDKRREVKLYSGLLKTNDIIMAHDFGNEIYDEDIDKTVLMEHQPFCQRFVRNNTLFKSFIKI